MGLGIRFCEGSGHEQCVSDALAEAERLCGERGVRLTALRKRVLFVIWQSHKALGAYDILNILATEDGRNAAPPTVYRALDFLLENRLIHRLASRNAFVGCIHPSYCHEGCFLICSECDDVFELEQAVITRSIASAAKQVGFSMTGQMVEVVGICQRCQGCNHD